MTYPTITPLPAAPQRTQDPDAFANTADTFVAALPDLVTDVNAAGAYIDNKSILVGNNFKGTYSAGTTYLVGESVLSSSKYYVSLVNANTGNTPASSPAQWSEIAGAPSVSGEVSLTATGTITAGDLVSLLSDGTAIKSTSPEFDTPTEYFAGGPEHISVCHIPGTQKYVVGYKGTSNFGNAVVVDYSSGSAVIGTPVVFNSASTEDVNCIYHAAQNVVVITYNDTVATDVEVIAASISGTTLTFGTSVQVHTAVSATIHTVYDSVNQAVVIAYFDATYKAKVLTVSGTTITLGSAVSIVPSTSLFLGVVFDVPSSKLIFSVGSSSNPGLNLVVGTVSGTSISFGTIYTSVGYASNGADISYTRLAYNSQENKTYAFGLISQQSSGELHIGFMSQVTVSGTNVALGKLQRLDDTNLSAFHYINHVGSLGVFYSAKDNAFYLLGNEDSTVFFRTAKFYKIVADGDFYAVEPAPFTPEIVFNPNNSAINFCMDADGSNLVVIGLSFLYTNLSRPHITRRSLAESTSLNWVGIAKASVTNGQTLSVVIPGGVATGLSSLTPGANYYTAGASYAKAGYEKIGKALSATSMLITG